MQDAYSNAQRHHQNHTGEKADPHKPRSNAGHKALERKKTAMPMSNQREDNTGEMFLHALVAKAAQLQMNNSNQLGN